MPEPLRRVPPSALIAGFDFSTGSVKALAFDLAGQVVAECRLPTDLWTDGGVSELSLIQLEGQVRASYRGLVAQLSIGHEEHHVAESTLALVLTALGDSLLGAPIADALALPRDTARALAADRLRARLESFSAAVVPKGQ